MLTIALAFINSKYERKYELLFFATAILDFFACLFMFIFFYDLFIQ